MILHVNGLLLTEAEYSVILKVASTGYYDVRVSDRTLLERSALRRYQRNKEHFCVKNNQLYYKGKELMFEAKCRRIVKDTYHRNKGIGIRRLYHVLKRRYAGISEDLVKHVLSDIPEYQKTTVKFPYKAPLKHVCSSSVHEILQVDLVDMQREAVIWNKQKCQFILSVMDIFSRFVWLRAIPSKSAKVVTKELNLIFAVFGMPKIIQHDRGREFDGEFKHLMRKLNIKDIKSRPYHPQSQGKIERMHKSLKRKIAYDLAHASTVGVNWANQLSEYQRIMNNSPKECLAWNTPHDIYYGRDPTNDGSMLNAKRNAKKLRDVAKAATIKCNKRNDRALGKSIKTPVFSIGDTVFLRYKKKGLLNRRVWVVDGVIKQRSLKTNMYNIEYKIPRSTHNGKQCTETKWCHVSDINLRKPACVAEKKRLHKKQYYIKLTTSSALENLRSEFGLPIRMNPAGNGNCQFAAVSYQLRQYGIHRSEETLRQEVVSFLRQTPELGGRLSSECWWNSVLERPDLYLSRMARNYEYGDQVTLQAISQLFNIQIVVVSTMNSATTLISPDGSSNVSNNVPLIVLGHYPEGAGEHYVALGADRDKLEIIIDRSTQITWDTRHSTLNNTYMDSECSSNRSTEVCKDNVSLTTNDMASRNSDMDLHTYELHNYEFDFCNNNTYACSDGRGSNVNDIDLCTIDTDLNSVNAGSDTNLHKVNNDMNFYTGDDDMISRSDDNDMSSHSGDNDINVRSSKNLNFCSSNIDANLRSGDNDMNFRGVDNSINFYNGDNDINFRGVDNDIGNSDNGVNVRSSDDGINFPRVDNDMNFCNSDNDVNVRNSQNDMHSRNSNDMDTCNGNDINSPHGDIGKDLNNTNSSSDFQTSVKRLKRMIHLKRQPRRVRQKNHVRINLPTEIWDAIISIVLKDNPSARYSLQRVSKLFRDIVKRTPVPRLYLNPDLFRNIHVSPISVRRMISIAGRGSGLVQAVRNIITDSSWANAWLFLRMATFCGWYTIERIWYRRSRR